MNGYQIMHMPFTVRAWQQWKALRGHRSGAAAVEFALIAFPLFFLIFGLLEISMIFVVSTALENGIIDSARAIRIGQTQQSGTTVEDFQTELCDRLPDFIECDGRLHVDVRILDSFSDDPNHAPIDGSGEVDEDDMQFNPGATGDIVVVRGYYQWHLITPVLSAPLANMSNGRRLLVGSTAFRNEPW